MKNLVIFFQGNYSYEHHDNAFFDMPDFTKQCFLEFIELFNNDKNINIFICRGSESHIKKSDFSYGFLYNKNKGFFEFYDKNIHADFIFNRSSYYFEKGFNDNNLIDFCRNKLSVYNQFSQFSPKTKLIKSSQELFNEIDKNTGNKKVVLKSITGSGGDNIIISDDKRTLKEYNSFPCLFQEYLDTSEGIPGICKIKHDLRIVIVNGKICYSFYRVPAENSDISNLSKGGTLHSVEISDLPPEIFNIVDNIDMILDKFKNRYYSIDVGFTQVGIKLFELNSSPIISSQKLGAEKLHKEIYKLIINNI